MKYLGKKGFWLIFIMILAFTVILLALCETFLFIPPKEAGQHKVIGWKILGAESSSIDNLRSSLNDNIAIRLALLHSPNESRRKLMTLPPVEPRVIEHGSRDSSLIALTFDLCEKVNDLAGFDIQIVETLETRNAKATFFMGGKWAESHPREATLLGANPLFETGNHSFSHKNFIKIPKNEQEEEISNAQESIYLLTGRLPKIFRFPYGAYDGTALKVVGEQGLTAIQWDIETGDPDPSISAEDILQAVRQKASGGSIIIMHANGRGHRTAEALPGIIDTLRSEGYQLVTVTEILRFKRTETVSW